MKVQFGSIIVAGSGSLGGHNVSPTRSGFALRSNPRGRKCASSKQCLSRSRYASICKQWQGLSRTNKLSFINATRGDLSGFQLFMAYNRVNSLFNVPLATSYVYYDIPIVPIVTGCVLNRSLSSLLLSFSSSAINTYYCCLYATRPISNGKHVNDNDFRLVAALSPRAWSNYNFYNDYITTFGSVALANGTFYVKFRIACYGQLSAFNIFKSTLI